MIFNARLAKKGRSRLQGEPLQKKIPPSSTLLDGIFPSKDL